MSKLLIVDDEFDAREFLAKFFRKRKIEVSTVSSGEEALELAEVRRPDLVLLDIKMNGMSGIDTLKAMKEKYKDIKVIMVTGKNSEEDQAMEVCKAYGALDYIHKPLVLDELEQVVMKTLRQMQPK